MVKNRFCKNLFQVISWGISCIVLILALLGGYVMSLQSGADSGWILLAFTASIVLLFFAIGFYWIFQTVEINNEGIQVKIFQKIIRTVTWSDVISIEEKIVMKNPAYVLAVQNQARLNLDKRKKIQLAIIHYGGDQFLQI